MFFEIEWESDDSLSDFLHNLALETAAQEEYKSDDLILSIDKSFLENYAELDKSGRKDVSKALFASSMMRGLSICTLPPPVDHRLVSAFRKLCNRCLVHMPQLIELRVCYEGDGYVAHMEHASQSLRQIKELTITSITSNGNLDNFRGTMESLEGHPNLEEIWLHNCLGNAAWPYLTRIPALSLVALNCGRAYLDAKTPDQRAVAITHSLAQLFSSDLPNALVDIRNLKVPTQEAMEALAACVSRARVKGIELTDSEFILDATPLAQAFAESKLKILHFSLLKFQKESRPMFLNALAASLPTMQQLEELHFVRTFVYEFDSNCVLYHHALIAIVHAATKCSSLRRFEIEITRGSDDIDAALAQLLRSPVKLEDLTILCEAGIGREVALALPALEEALKSNYYIGSIDFEQFYGGSRTWDTDFRARIQTLLQLNQAGRKYLAKDASNKLAAIQVFDKVKDNQDCIFVHLRENAGICGRQNPSETKEEGSSLANAAVEAPELVKENEATVSPMTMPDAEIAFLRSELERLQHANERLQEENAFLKKQRGSSEHSGTHNNDYPAGTGRPDARSLA